MLIAGEERQKRRQERWKKEEEEEMIFMQSFLSLNLQQLHLLLIKI